MLAVTSLVLSKQGASHIKSGRHLSKALLYSPAFPERRIRHHLGRLVALSLAHDGCGTNIHFRYLPAPPNTSLGTMPVCPHPYCPCGHKNVTPDVLINHVESSPWAALYFCGICRCVCKNESVLILHKQKVHKTIPTAVPTVVPTQQSRASLSPHSCRICDRAYVTASALEQHYRDTPVHPKCTRCNLGFADNAAIQAHVISTHRPITCNNCNGIQVYAEDIARHYKISPNHPSCTICDIGFENKEAFDEHDNTRHPQFRCKTCNIPFGSTALLDAHYRDSPRHPRCPECQLSFEDNLALVKHTSQMSLHDAFSDASVVTRSSRSPSPVHSFRGAWTGVATPTRSVTSSVSGLQRQFSPPTTSVNTAVASDFSIPMGPPSVTSQLSPSSISTPSLMSRSATVSDKVIERVPVISDERADLNGSARGRGSSRQSISSDFLNGGPGHSPRTVSRASAKTVSPPPPNHVVFPTPGQCERFRIISRANSPTESHDSERVHSPSLEPQRQLSPMENFSKATREPKLTEWRPPSLTHGPTAGPEALNTSPQLPSRERFVSHVYCRMCRRDPCRQPAATMCGHIFCHQCISSEVVKTSQCPVCEVPTLLYSIFRLHLA
ncbi:hypothetical protein EI94DRAFT_490157 [Lactarius quietus]|nr:hypothetical protein EI94DRAFT_490157 [Lactarius quietus]